MTAPRRTTQEIIDAYRATGSVWRAGQALGIAGQTVHERLRAVGHPMQNRRWGQAEDAELRRLIEGGIPLGEVARALGRSYGSATTRASSLGIESPYRRRRSHKLPRGIGLDKRSVRDHLRRLEADSRSVTQYARAHLIKVDMLIAAFEQHYPEEWCRYVEAHASIPRRECAYCGRPFYPNSSRQECCTRKCAADRRADRAYFGGRRRSAIGMDAGICQLCGREGRKGLAAHHVLGKENDPENDALVALCPGCHQLVTRLAATKSVIDSETALESLVSLAWIRRHGGDLSDGEAVHIIVDIDRYSED